MEHDDTPKSRTRASTIRALPPIRELRIRYPSWVDDLEWSQRRRNDQEKMSLAIAVARLNVENETGGPFGAAIFDRDSGEPIALGMNLVLLAKNSTLHAEMVAAQVAQARLGSHTLRGDRRYELFASCEPCAMCLGATLWAGITRLVTGAIGEDARAIGFDEGPVFPESYAYLAARGIEIVKGVSRDEAKAVLDLYLARGGPIYNGAAK